MQTHMLVILPVIHKSLLNLFKGEHILNHTKG